MLVRGEAGTVPRTGQHLLAATSLSGLVMQTWVTMLSPLVACTQGCPGTMGTEAGDCLL